jgi:signal transduction histidine kinase
VSSGPKQGAGLTASIVWAWAIAGACAVAVAAGLGYVLAGRISEPIAQLTRISGEMAAGDLSVRAAEGGDREVNQLAQSFNEMAAAVEDTVESQRRFVGDAAHEIGTPLTALQADLELARESPTDECVPDLLDRSLDHAERVRRITRDLLVLSRMESAGAPAEHLPVDVTLLAAAGADTVASRADQADIDLVVQTESEPLLVLGDQAALGRAIANLLDNALKFTPTGGIVSISTRRHGDTAVVEVSDTGCGIPIEDLPHVFERFHRARDTTSVPGSGLGLAIVKAIVEAHRGTVHIDSSPAGTRVEIDLPLAR